MKHWFRHLAQTTSNGVGSPYAFSICVLIIVLWALSGPAFGFSDTWQLIINTGTTIITFLMVFLIQNTQNRDSRALHLKLDELIRATQNARNELIDLEEMSDEELDKLHQDLYLSRNATDQQIETVREHKEKKRALRKKK